MSTTKTTFTAKSGATASGEIILPAGTEEAPGVLLIQEWWGLNDHIRSLASRLADAGFVVLAPDLYHGVSTTDPAEAGRLMTELDGERSMDELRGAVAFLASHPRCSGKVGITGFCMGGAFAFRAAANIPELGAAVPFYGIPPAASAPYAQVKCPVLAHFARRDPWAQVSKAEDVRSQILAAGGQMELCVYDADHAFVNDTRPEVYSPDDARLAWERTLAFLHQHLG